MMSPATTMAAAPTDRPTMRPVSSSSVSTAAVFTVPEDTVVVPPSVVVVIAVVVKATVGGIVALYFLGALAVLFSLLKTKGAIWQSPI